MGRASRRSPGHDASTRPSPRRTARNPSCGCCWVVGRRKGQGDGTHGGWLLRAGTLPALPFIRHVTRPAFTSTSSSTGEGTASDPFERFDTRVEAESFANDPEMVKKYGRMEAIDCTRRRAPSALRREAGHDHQDSATGPAALPSTTTKLQTEMGNLYVTVSVDEDGEPFEVFGWLRKRWDRSSTA